MARSTSRVSQPKENSSDGPQPPAGGFNFCRCTVPREPSPQYHLSDGTVPRAGRSTADVQRLAETHSIRVTKPGSVTAWHYINDTEMSPPHGRKRFVERTPPLQSVFDPTRQGPPLVPPHRLYRKSVECHIDLGAGATQGDSLRFGKQMTRPPIKTKAVAAMVDRTYHPVTPWHTDQ